jgi:hypothetical protein
MSKVMKEVSLLKSFSGTTDGALFAWSGIYNYVQITDLIVSPKSATKAWFYYSGTATNLIKLDFAAAATQISFRTPITIGKDNTWLDLRAGTEQNGEINYLINFRWDS